MALLNSRNPRKLNDVWNSTTGGPDVPVCYPIFCSHPTEIDNPVGRQHSNTHDTNRAFILGVTFITTNNYAIGQRSRRLRALPAYQARAHAKRKTTAVVLADTISHPQRRHAARLLVCIRHRHVRKSIQDSHLSFPGNYMVRASHSDMVHDYLSKILYDIPSVIHIFTVNANCGLNSPLPSPAPIIHSVFRIQLKNMCSRLWLWSSHKQVIY